MSASVESDLIIITSGTTKDHGDRIASVISGMISHLEREQGFDFRRMHRVIATADYAGELAALSAETPSQRPIRHTNEEYIQGVAIVQPFRHGDDFELVVVVDMSIAALLAPTAQDGGEQDGEEPDRYFMALHMLHHEFCHVHDLNKKLDAFPTVMLRQGYSGKDGFIRPVAEACWSEYYANRRSSPTADDASLAYTAENLASAIKRTKSLLDKEILSYRRHADLGRLMDLMERHGGALAKAAAYMLGYVDGLGDSLEALSADTANTLSGSYFEPSWHALHDALRGMYALYPEGWKGLTAYDALAEALEGYFNALGFIFSDSKDGLHVSIPFRPETMPSMAGLPRGWR